MKLEEAKQKLEEFVGIFYEFPNPTSVSIRDYEVTAIETVLQALDSSIPKEKARKKMEDLKKAKERNTKRNFDTVYKDGYYTGGIDAIYELLEDNQC